MKKVRLTVVAFVLAIAMVMPMAVVAGNYYDPQVRVEDGVAYVPLRAIVYAFGATVEWDGARRAAHITRMDGETLVIVIEEIGGFIENGVSWIPFELAESIVEDFLFAAPATGQVDRIDLSLWEFNRFEDIRETTFSTGLPYGAIAVNYIEYMSDNLPARSAFTYRELETAVWIVEELLAMGHDWDNIAVQEFTYWEIREMEIGLMPLNWATVTSPFILGEGRDYQLREDRVSQNVVLTLPGQSERKIVVGAHYDSPPYPSASDNASGTALLMESAQRMLETEHYYTIVYVFFGSEEVGLIGAYYYLETLTARQRDNIVMMVNADVIIEGPYLFYGAGAMPEADDELIAQLRTEVFEAAIDIITAQYETILAHFEEMGVEDPSQMMPFDSLEDFLEGAAADIAAMDSTTLLMQAGVMGIIDPAIDVVAQQVSAIAAEFYVLHGIEFISAPGLIAFPTDSLAFLFEGHTVVNLVGLERIDNVSEELAAQLTRLGEGYGDFTVTILHTPLDEFHTIEGLWPGMMNANLEAFVLFLEAILTGSFS